MSSRKIIDLRGRKARFFYRQPRPLSTRVPLRERKRKTRIVLGVLCIAVLSAGAFGLHFVSYMERFSVKDIAVRGVQTIDPTLIQQYVGHVVNDGSRHFVSRDSIFLYPRKVIEQDLVKDFPRIEMASISRPSLFSNTLIIEVRERVFFALWCMPQILGSERRCYQMDDSGHIFAEAASDNRAKYVFGGGIQGELSSTTPRTSPIGLVFIPTHLQELTDLFGRLEAAGFDLSGASVESDQDYVVMLKDSFTLKVSFGGETADTLVKNLQLVLSNPPLRGNEKNISYIDLRFGDRVYYKMSAAIH